MGDTAPNSTSIAVNAYVWGDYDPPDSFEWIKLEDGLYVPCTTKSKTPRATQVFSELPPLFKKLDEGSKDLHFIDFIPRSNEHRIEQVVARANRLLTAAKFNPFSIETVSVSMSMSCRKLTKIRTGGDGIQYSYQLIRVWYDACDEANSTSEAQALFSSLEGKAVQDVNVQQTKEGECVIQ
jgi:hypothetical protein